jgi:hypothetical protein
VGFKQKNGSGKRSLQTAFIRLMLVLFGGVLLSTALFHPQQAYAAGKYAYTDAKYTSITGPEPDGNCTYRHDDCVYSFTYTKVGSKGKYVSYDGQTGLDSICTPYIQMNSKKYDGSKSATTWFQCVNSGHTSQEDKHSISIDSAGSNKYIAVWIDHNHLKVYPASNPDNSVIYFDNHSDNNDNYVAQGQSNGCDANVIDNFPHQGGDPDNADGGGQVHLTINEPAGAGNSNCSNRQVTISQFQHTENYAKYFIWVDSGKIETTDGRSSFTLTGGGGVYMDNSGTCKSQITPNKGDPAHGKLIIRADGDNPFTDGYSPQISNADLTNHSGCNVSKPLPVNIANPSDTGGGGGKASDKAPGTGTEPGGGGSGSSSDDGELSCEYSANALSWIICPAVNLMTDAIEETDSVITNELNIPQQDIFCTDQDTCNDYYGAWSSFRDISLGLVVIAGLITVVSQAIGMEILDAYTVRKMLPRILVAAIGITLSWTLMSFAVTLANNLGYGVRDLILAPFHDVLGNSTISFSTSAAAILGGLTGFILGVGALVASIGILLSYIATAGLAVIIAITVLVLRQLVIIMLMILSPVAFIAYVLPNTERVFRLWWESFSKALLMFPLIVAFIAAGRVFAAISLTNSQSLFSQLTAMIAYFGPYFAIPLTFRMSGGIMSGMGNFINQRGQPLAGRLSKYRGEKAASQLKRARAGKLFDENFGRFKVPEKVPWLGGKESGVGELYNRAAVNLTDQDELLPWRLGRPRDKVNPLTGKKWQGMWGMRRGAKDLQDQLDNRAINESTKAMEEVGDMHYEAWRGVSGQHQDFKGRDASGKLISQRLAEAGFVDSKTGAIRAPSSIGDFEKMGHIMMESDNDKEALGGEDLLQHSGTLASIKHRPDMEYADTQVMAAIAQSAAGRAEPEALANIGNSIQSRLGKGVAQRTMKAAQKAASRTERPDLRDGHGIILNRKTGQYESSYSDKNYRSSTAVGSILSVKGSSWSGAKAEAVEAAERTIVHIAKGGTGDKADVQAVTDMIRDGIRNPYNDAGQKKAWRSIAQKAGLTDLVDAPPMSKQEWEQLNLLNEPAPEPEQPQQPQA